MKIIRNNTLYQSEQKFIRVNACSTERCRAGVFTLDLESNNQIPIHHKKTNSAALSAATQQKKKKVM